jgi:CubicO group peptidase (beta-lactamase class C family)
MQVSVFDPLKMNVTTFDYARALDSNHATPHGDGLNGKPSVASMAFNYSIYPVRPAGGVWTSSGDLIKYVKLEMDQGRLPNLNNS